MDSTPQTIGGPDTEVLAERALGFDVGAELELCQQLAAYGGPARVKDVFDGRRAARLFQALLCTGRHKDMDDHWRQSIETGIERGALAPPEWN